MKTVSRFMSRGPPRVSAATAITSLESWSAERPKMRSMDGEYPRPRLSERSLPQPKGCFPTALRSGRQAEEAGIAANQLRSVLKFAEGWIERQHSDSETVSALAEIIERLELSRDGIRVALKIPIFPPEERGAAPPSHIALTKLVPIQLKRRWVAIRILLQSN